MIKALYFAALKLLVFDTQGNKSLDHRSVFNGHCAFPFTYLRVEARNLDSPDSLHHTFD